MDKQASSLILSKPVQESNSSQLLSTAINPIEASRDKQKSITEDDNDNSLPSHPSQEVQGEAVDKQAYSTIYSSELSYQSKPTSVSVTHLTEPVSQTKDLVVCRHTTEFDHITETKSLFPVHGKAMYRKEIIRIQKLKNFPVNLVKVEDDRYFDGKCEFMLAYLCLCEKEKKDPLDYYMENSVQKQIIDIVYGDPQDEEKFESEMLQYLANIEEGGIDEGITQTSLTDIQMTATNCIFMQEQLFFELLNWDLETFPIDSVKIREERYFDGRCESTLKYLGLCRRRGIDPLDYYLQNYDEKNPEKRMKTFRDSLANELSAHYANLTSQK